MFTRNTCPFMAPATKGTLPREFKDFQFEGIPKQVPNFFLTQR